MKSRTKIALTMAIILLLSLTTLATVKATAVVDDGYYHGSTHFRGFIDGSDYLYIQYGGAVVWYNHRSYNLPGMWDGHHDATYIDGVAWMPNWITNYLSDKYYSPTPHPTSDWTITSLNVNEGRGAVTVEQQPSSSNVYTAIILLNDDNFGGAVWYDFTLNWQSDIPTAPGGTNLYLTMNGPASMDQGNSMTYTLFYNNFGADTASNVVLTAALSPDITFTSATNEGTYDSDTNAVTWNLGTVAAFPTGQGWESVTVNIPDTTAVDAVVTSTASISTTTSESKYIDNDASTSTTVTQPILPPNVNLGPLNGNSGDTPVVYWGNPVTFSYTDPLFGTAQQATSVNINIHVNDGKSDIVSAMSGPSSSGVWTYTITFYPRHGEATVTYTPHRPSEPTPTPIQFNIYIDPAGYVYDLTTNARISGATVTLQRPNGDGGWENVPTGLALMIPDTNPITTDINGQYQWNTIAGSYRVHVEATGYYPANSIAVTVPPPVFDLNVGLAPLSTTTPTARFTTSASSAPVGSPITFDPSTSTAGDHPIVRYEWDWTNDGTYDFATTTPEQRVCAFSVPGVYTVTLRVTDSAGLTDTTSHQVTVVPAFALPESALGSLLAIGAGLAAFAIVAVGKLRKQPKISLF